jgi:serine/threonine protein kinase
MVEPAELSGMFGGRYQIRSKLGAGGMGTVYLADDTWLTRRVALKVPHFGDDEALAIDRFKREARVAANTDHPNICPVYDIGEVNGVHYFTMPYIVGESLAAHINADHPWDIDRAVALVGKLARAMAEMHRQGVVHRDLKPGNVMINQRSEPVLLDFGLARIATATAAGKTILSSGHIAGTPPYMSPEQFEGDSSKIGPASDIYSLGAVLYELATGRTPFGDIPVAAIYGAIHRHESPPPPSDERPDIDAAFDALCLKALAHRPEDRFDSMTSFAEALDHYRDERQKSLTLDIEESNGHTAATLDTTPSIVPVRPRAPSSGSWAGVLITVLLTTGVLVAAGVVIYQLSQPTGEGKGSGARDGPGGKPRDKDNGERPATVEVPHFVNKLGMKMVWVRPGQFVMGEAAAAAGGGPSENGPPHLVAITRPLAVSAYEVTVGQFRAFVNAKDRPPYRTEAETIGKGWGFDKKAGNLSDDRAFSWKNVGWERKDPDRHPVVNVSWNDAMRFCAWLSTQEEGARYDLLTEAEWEFCCRAGTTTRFFSGDDAEKLIDVANVADASYDRLFPGRATIKGDAATPSRPRSASSGRTPSGFTTCTATSGSGARTANAPTLPRRRPARTRSRTPRARRRGPGCCAAAPGLTTRTGAAAPSAARNRPGNTTAASASASSSAPAARRREELLSAGCLRRMERV